MIPRRNLVTGGVLGGVVGALLADNGAEAAPPGAPADVSDETVRMISQAIHDLTTEVRNLKAFVELSPVRDVQLQFLRTNTKLPDFLEVGIAVWFAVHDWHIRWQQPMTLGRDAQGRNTILLNQTALIMRTDTNPGFVGLPYDGK